MSSNDVLKGIRANSTPQTEKARDNQVLNNAGGYVFELDDLARLRRFLVLGAEGGTYYAAGTEVARDNAKVVFRLAEAAPEDAVAEIVEISQAGRAPKNNPALFALAIIAKTSPSVNGRRAALTALPLVARTATHLFTFAGYLQQFGGWGRATRTAVASWYEDKSPEQLAYQAAKYRSRDGWSHRDLLRLSHPKAESDGKRAVYGFILGKDDTVAGIPLLEDFAALQAATSNTEIIELIKRGNGISWEMLPDSAINDPKVWDVLLTAGVPMTALIRQLPRLTRIGVAQSHKAKIVAQLTNQEALTKARVHPLQILVAMRTYAGGEGRNGRDWEPVTAIIDALDKAFYLSFGNVRSSGKRTLLALDVSGSMGVPLGNLPITAREGSAAMALITAAAEPDFEVVAFAGGPGAFGETAGNRYGWPTAVKAFNISPRQRLDDVIKATDALEMGFTDCALPILYALDRNLKVDTFVIYTDSETYFGKVHPFEALKRYRKETGIEARLVVVGMTATGFTIADPSDSGTLDVVGFDTATPNVISDFSAGLI